MTTDPDITTALSPVAEAMATRTDILRVKHLETLGWRH